MTIRSDLAIYDHQGNLALVIEIKNKRGTDAEWATKLRRNMIVHRFLPSTPFFLLALPDRFYLWKNDQSSDLKEPDYEIESAAILDLYAEKLGLEADSLSETGLELLLASWMRELIWGTHFNDLLPSNSEAEWLIESGLLDAVKHGNVVSETVL